MTQEITAALQKAVRVTQSPGAVLYVGDESNTYLHEATGMRQITPKRRPAQLDTLYDLASLTKVIATATSVMKLRDAGHLRLDQSITDFLPIPAFREMTVLHLLTHTAGLVPGNPYYLDATSLEEMFRRYAIEGIARAPGVLRVYSDVGFMLLGRMVEVIAQDTLDAFAKEQIFDPLGMTRTAYRPPKSWIENTAATERCEWRKRLIIGEVHDENAYAVGGVAGHAGLFSTATDIATFCRALLAGKVLKESTLHEMTTMDKVPSYPWQGLGWLIDPWPTKAQGFLPSRHALGHTGWTGTSIWMDKSTGLFAILLSNTCHPSRRRRDNTRLRRIVYTAVADTFYPTLNNTHTGLDRLYKEDFRAVNGKRIALLTHHAAVDQFNRTIQQVLAMAPNTQLRRLYSPEHGLSGQAEAGEHVGAQAQKNVPVTSLYGKQKAPTQEELREIDLFVIDLQDIGARYYTYPATMKRCMAACAKARVPILVLDRPNPLGGEIIEGPIAEKTSSDVCWAKVPVRHGMTMGELATYFAQTEFRRSRLSLTINHIDTRGPEFLFDETPLPWISPSPNIPDPETALLYVGMCLFEGTNLNEGRGTDTPFALLGAPWLNSKAVIDAVPSQARVGCALQATTYTPRAIEGKASNPRFQDTECQGIRILLKDTRSARPFTLAVALLSALHGLHRDKLEWSPFFDTLAGGGDLRRRITKGQDPTRIISAYARALAKFDRRRPKFYARKT